MFRQSYFFSSPFFTSSKVFPITTPQSEDSQVTSSEPHDFINRSHSLSESEQLIKNQDLNPIFFVYITHHKQAITVRSLAHCLNKNTPHILALYENNSYKIINKRTEENSVKTHPLAECFLEPISLEKLTDIIEQLKPENASLLLCGDANLGDLGGAETSVVFHNQVTALKPTLLFPLTANENCLIDAQQYMLGQKTIKGYELPTPAPQGIASDPTRIKKEIINFIQNLGLLSDYIQEPASMKGSLAP